MTRELKKPKSEFSKWLNEEVLLDSRQAKLCTPDIDQVIHKYVVVDSSTGRQLPRQHIMLIETKIGSEELNKYQRDTLSLLNRVLEASNQTIIQSTMRGYVKVFYHGLHILRLDEPNPKNCKSMWWTGPPPHGRGITIDMLRKLLLFEIDAYTLKKREDRSHHKAHPVLDKEWVYPPL